MSLCLCGTARVGTRAVRFGVRIAYSAPEVSVSSSCGRRDILATCGCADWQRTRARWPKISRQQFLTGPSILCSPPSLAAQQARWRPHCTTACRRSRSSSSSRSASLDQGRCRAAPLQTGPIGPLITDFTMQAKRLGGCYRHRPCWNPHRGKGLAQMECVPTACVRAVALSSRAVAYSILSLAH